jgi:hypothetical protein
LNWLNPTFFEVAGSAITLAKMMASAGLLLEIGGVCVLTWNEYETRGKEKKAAREEHEAAKASRAKAKERLEASRGRGRGKLEKGEYRLTLGSKEQRDLADCDERVRATKLRVELASGMTTRMWLGIGLILGGFLVQLGGTLIS